MQNKLFFLPDPQPIMVRFYQHGEIELLPEVQKR